MLNGTSKKVGMRHENGDRQSAKTKRAPRLQRVRTPGIRASLVMLAVGCILPVASISAFLIFNFYGYEQTQLIDNAVSRARAIIYAADRDFANIQASLLALSTSHRLAHGDLGGFHARALQALRDIRAESIMDVDTRGQLLLTTRRPFGEPLPKLASMSLVKQIIESGQPGVSNLYVGAVAGHFIYTIGVPIKQDGATVSLLAATVGPAQLASILADQKLPDAWRAAITDSSGAVVARTHGIEQFIGTKVDSKLLQRMSESDEGSFKGRTLDGIPVVTVYSRSHATGWSAVLGIPLKELTAGLRQTLIQLIIATCAALAVGLSLAWFIGGRIARSVTAIGKTALALSFGEKLVIPRLHFHEAVQLGQALLDAEATLRRSRHEAHHDALTGLPNRTALQMALNRLIPLCRRNKSSLAILYIDLDGFKAVNDTHGHAAGDQLLRAVSVRIREAIRASDIPARLGGDEFAIALIDSDLENARLFSAKLIETLSAPYPLGAIDIGISASIGIAGYPGAAADADTLLKHADKAMYRAKALGKRRFCVAPG
jgi:diguanylate cyclase (GGDEF)-like protein